MELMHLRDDWKAIYLAKLQDNRLENLLWVLQINPIALRKDKIVYNFGLSECKRVKNKNLIFQLSSCDEASGWS